ncbi:hypothetical protein HJFPF1_10985 [Paramyrothecium foliicola]|nr:hypothetical protein HJFPF1_10985 [Paramyrothecium foliicola]
MAKDEAHPRREMKVLALGLFRTGSASIAKALETLGYQDVYHLLKCIESQDDFKILNRAADATFPTLATYTGKAFSRQEWDELFGSCEAATDVASFFALELIQAYPEAKVLLVERDFNAWFSSVDEVVSSGLFGPRAEFILNVVQPILGSEGGIAMRKLFLGWFQARNLEEIRRNARTRFDRHYQQIREAVPPERLLVYKMGDGWEPLCDFLGKPVPDLEFPWVNERKEIKKRVAEKIRKDFAAAFLKLLFWIGAAATVAMSLWIINGFFELGGSATL